MPVLSDRTMTAAPNPQKQRRQRIVLPFEKRKTDFATWAYDHRVGLLITVAAYLLLGIAFVSSKIVFGGSTPGSVIYIDLKDIPEKPQPEELTAEERHMLEQQIMSARNLVSNENAAEDVDPRRARETLPADVSNAAGTLNERMRANSAAYEQGLRDVENMGRQREQPNPGTAGDRNQDVKYTSSVQISFNLEGRNSVYLHNPAYKCEGSGQVVVSISVNRNGNVTNASVNSASSSDPCLRERALDAALRSRFNADSSAPVSQKGTITYLFIPQ